MWVAACAMLHAVWISFYKLILVHTYALTSLQYRIYPPNHPPILPESPIPLYFPIHPTRHHLTAAPTAGTAAHWPTARNTARGTTCTTPRTLACS